jgi:serine/threonine-protein kinase
MRCWLRRPALVAVVTLLLAVAMLALLFPTPSRSQPEDKQKLAAQVKDIFTRNCYRCHGQNGAHEGRFDWILDFKKLVGPTLLDPKNPKVVAGSPEKSRLFIRMGVRKDMPYPEDEQPRPTEAEIAVVKKWIETGAPVPADEPAQARKFVSLQDELTAIRDYLKKQAREDRGHVRFFSLRHLANLPPDKVRDADLRVYQAALSKLVNSVSWKEKIVVPEAVDRGKTLFAVDIRKLDWDRGNLWQEVLKHSPYALSHARYPDDGEVNDLAEEVYALAGTNVPAVRADWFIATASRPPLYHILAQIPAKATEMEKKLGVDVQRNFQDGTRVKRAGFNGSGVSGHNRMVERHDALHGAYWKSYDFKTSAGRGNLFVFPLGPNFKGNPFAQQAFEHAGGEIIFNLPNRLQAYMLVNAKDERIDEGPVEIVSDGKKVSGTPLVVNGLSCMSCHEHGMIHFTDQVRSGNILGGSARDFVRRLYPESAVMEEEVKRDEKRFLGALDEATGRFLKVGADAGKDVKDFPEPISAIARWYLVQELTSTEAAAELGLADARTMEGAIKANPLLQRDGLFPLARGHTLKREVWESTEFSFSPFQRAAKELKLGEPEVFR